MAQNPNPQLALANIKGVTRTLDDWATVFSLGIVLLPARPEASAFVPVIDRIFKTLGDSDLRCVVCVSGNPSIARRILGDAADRYLVFCDDGETLAASLGLERLPALVHLRQDTSLVTSAQGWSPTEWQKTADEIAKKNHWTSPVVSGPGDPAATPGWPVRS